MIERTWWCAYTAALLLLLAGLLHHHWQILTAPVPLDLYEGTMPLITGIIAEGHNPFTREFQPHAAVVYPPLYNIMVAPLTAVFGNTLQLHRAVSALFIVLSALLCGGVTAKHSGSRLQGVAAGVMFYAALLFYGTPVASTNALGVFIFLLGVTVPWWRGFATGSLLVALLCGVLAFYAKQYFILGMAMLCLYLFLYVSMTRALLLGLGYAVVLLGSVYLVHLASPYYLDNTFFTPGIAGRRLRMWSILLLQLRQFGFTYLGLLLLLLAVGWLSLYRQGLAATWERLRSCCALARAGWRGPLLRRPVDYFWFCFFWAMVAIVVLLGRNPGNYMTYLFQLMSPFLLIATFRLVGQLRSHRVLLCAPLLASFYLVYAILPKDFSFDAQNWRRIEAIIAEHDEILATQMLVMTLLEQHKRIYQNGHTFYFPLAAEKPALFIKRNPQDRVAAIWDGYITDIYRRIERQEFDLILISPWEMRGIFLRNPPPFGALDGRAFLRRYYEVEQKIPLSMTDRYGGGTYDIGVWRPRRP